MPVVPPEMIEPHFDNVTLSDEEIEHMVEEAQDAKRRRDERKRNKRHFRWWKSEEK